MENNPIEKMYEDKRNESKEEDFIRLSVGILAINYRIHLIDMIEENNHQKDLKEKIKIQKDIHQEEIIHQKEEEDITIIDLIKIIEEIINNLLKF